MQRQSQQPQRAEHQRLRLEQDGNDIARKRCHPFPFDREKHRQHKEQGHQRVRLAPGSADGNHQGIEQIQRQESQHGGPRELLCLRFLIEDGAQGDIRQNGRHLYHEFRGPGAGSFAEQAHDPQDQHVGGRIIAGRKRINRVIEAGGAVRRHSVGPGAEAADIHIVAG